MRLSIYTVWYLRIVVIFILMCPLQWFEPDKLQAQDCTIFMRSEPNTTLTEQISNRLTQINVIETVTVSTYQEVCFNEQTGDAQKATPISTDFDFIVNVEDLMDLKALGDLTTQLLFILPQFPPNQTPGNESGLVTIIYQQDGLENYVQFTVTDGISASNQQLTGEALMNYLNYQIDSGSALVRLAPSTVNLTTCNEADTTMVQVSQINQLNAFAFELTFDPTIVEVVDADPNQEGIQVKPAQNFAFVVINQVDNTKGLIQFSAALLDIRGEQSIFGIEWLVKNVGETKIVFNRSELVQKTENIEKSEQTIPHLSQNGKVTVSSTCSQITGVVQLQGRSDHSNIIVQNQSGQQATTNVVGEFNFIGEGPITATHAGYLTAVAKADNSLTDVGQITLFAGDINADNRIDIFDLSYIGAHYGNNQAQADINNDGIVNILDVALAGNNYNKQGPQSNWQ